MKLNKGFFLVFLFFSIGASAKVFRNAYISFDMPDNWNCVLEQTEWVCRSSATDDAKQAIIILTAKEVGPTDTFDLYRAHMNSALALKQKAGVTSKPIYQAKDVKINDQPWIDGLQLSSEVNNYYTRYMATIKDKIAILVTLSAHQKNYTKYSENFQKTIQSLRVVATSNLLAQPESKQLRPGNEVLGVAVGDAVPADMAGTDVSNPDATGKKSGNKTKMLFAGIAVILAALGGFIYMRMKG